ncbi:hypothetical protein AQUCO_00700477v1 [Aquilegia coerulea]|uniref:Methyltransferase FkbM domain-containing protein n=1 Tax=Aquilegia coerulea TaxID=218851 RepID=A0A2G5EK60_AQUCA|nr:hypothetical protein AQUCO_00700477v1 [Aquilegia coerulea]
MANAWKRDKSTPFLTSRNLLLLFPISLLLIFFFYFTKTSNSNSIITNQISLQTLFPINSIQPFDCFKCPQSHPVIANLVEGVRYPFLYSLADLGSLPDKPHKNIVRMLKGKPFRRPDISVTIQDVLEKMKTKSNGYVVDVGANVGMATFAAAAMGFKVLAFEPVFENLQRICDGMFFNRVGDRVTLFEAAVSDRLGNITFHKLVGRLDNSAVSASGAKLAFKSNEEIELQVPSIPLDHVIPESEQVLLLKIDVQGWEYHVLRGASKLLSRKAGEAPYLIYEEDERLLEASNSSSKEIRSFLNSVGYHHCTMHGTDAHCTK